MGNHLFPLAACVVLTILKSVALERQTWLFPGGIAGYR